MQPLTPRTATDAKRKLALTVPDQPYLFYSRIRLWVWSQSPSTDDSNQLIRQRLKKTGLVLMLHRK